MSETFIQVPPDSTGKRVRTVERTIGGTAVHSRVVEIAEPISGIRIDPRFITGTVIARISGETVVGKISGETVVARVSGETVRTREDAYEKTVVSGAVIVNVVSGTAILHTVVISDVTSGFSMRIRDSSSGAVGTIISVPYASTRPPPWPQVLIFDCVMLSGIVVDTSGATWHATVTWRRIV